MGLLLFKTVAAILLWVLYASSTVAIGSALDEVYVSPVGGDGKLSVGDKITILVASAIKFLGFVWAFNWIVSL